MQLALRQEYEQVVGIAVRGRTVVPRSSSCLLQVAHEYACFGQGREVVTRYERRERGGRHGEEYDYLTGGQQLAACATAPRLTGFGKIGRSLRII
jgi:hypothetical protein